MTIPPPPSKAPPKADMHFARQVVETEIQQVDTLILEVVGEGLPFIRDVAAHLIMSGGKRIRPLLTLLCARLCGYEGKDHIKLAAAVEFIHTATLLHDDVVDESALRRGKPTANEAFGNKSSVLVGDFLFAQAFQLMVQTNSLAVLGALSHASAVIVTGEVKQLLIEGDPETSEATYLDVIYHKTAALFAAACESGAMLECDHEMQYDLAEFGKCIGMAFQLVDDALDYVADERTLGKETGNDLREGKITLPLIVAYHQGTKEEKAFWKEILEHKTVDDPTWQKALRYLHSHRAIKHTLGIASQYCAKARHVIEPLPEGDAKKALQEIITFCEQRIY